MPGNIPGADAAKDLQKKAQDAVDKGKKEADAAKEKAKKGKARERNELLIMWDIHSKLFFISNLWDREVNRLCFWQYKINC